MLITTAGEALFAASFACVHDVLFIINNINGLIKILISKEVLPFSYNGLSVLF